MQSFLAANVSEFFLFGTYLLHLGDRLEDHYQWSPWISVGVWNEHNNQQIQEAIMIKLPPRCFFGVHRRAFQNMDATTQDVLATLWYERKLFDSYRDAIRFVRDCAMLYT
jgi:hypothetical protein